MALPKYSRYQLKQMALELLEAKANHDGRYLEFCFAMMVRTGTTIEVVERKIIEYAALS